MKTGSFSRHRSSHRSHLLLLTALASASDLGDIIYIHVDKVNLTLDAHVPNGPGPFPAAVLIHGGG